MGISPLFCHSRNILKHTCSKKDISSFNNIFQKQWTCAYESNEFRRNINESNSNSISNSKYLFWSFLTGMWIVVNLWMFRLRFKCSYLSTKSKSLTLSPPNYSIWIFTHLKLCLADAIHNFKWVEIIQIWQNGGQLFTNLAVWCHILSLTYLKCGT